MAYPGYGGAPGYGAPAQGYGAPGYGAPGGYPPPAAAAVSMNFLEKKLISPFCFH